MSRTSLLVSGRSTKSCDGRLNEKKIFFFCQKIGKKGWWKSRNWSGEKTTLSTINLSVLSEVGIKVPPKIDSLKLKLAWRKNILSLFSKFGTIGWKTMSDGENSAVIVRKEEVYLRTTHRHKPVSALELK